MDISINEIIVGDILIMSDGSEFNVTYVDDEVVGNNVCGFLKSHPPEIVKIIKSHL